MIERRIGIVCMIYEGQQPELVAGRAPALWPRLSSRRDVHHPGGS
jgi:hypothetical protein